MTKCLQRLRVAALLLGTIAAGATSLHAQANPDSIKLRNDCRLAEHVLQTGNPAPHRAAALAIIPLCDGAPRLLVDVWRAGNLPSADVPALVTASRAVASPALGEELFAILQSPVRPHVDRVGALLVLLHWSVPSTVPDYADVTGDRDALLRSYYGSVDHHGVPTGLASLPEPVLDRLYPLVVRMGGDEPDATVRLATKVATNNLASACRARGWSCTSFAP